VVVGNKAIAVTDVKQVFAPLEDTTPPEETPPPEDTPPTEL
jgi:hypothetical protein